MRGPEGWLLPQHPPPQHAGPTQQKRWVNVMLYVSTQQARGFL